MENLNSSFVTLYNGKLFDVVSNQPQKNPAYSRRNSGHLDNASLATVADFEQFLLETKLIPRDWFATLLKDRFEIRLVESADNQFVARVVDGSGIEMNARFLTRPGAKLVLRHEVLHLMRRRRGLSNDPQWVEEGLAQSFAFDASSGGVGFPLEAFLGKPAIDLTAGSLHPELRGYEWYGKSFLFIYYLLGQTSHDRGQRLKNFWKLAEIGATRSEMGPTAYVSLLRTKLPALGIRADVYRDFLLAAALNRSHGVYDRKYYLFPTTLQMSYESLRAASHAEPCVSRFVWTEDSDEHVADFLRTWIDKKFHVERLPDAYPERPQTVSRSDRTGLPESAATSDPRSVFYLLWCEE